MQLTAAVLVTLVATATAHLCMLSPRQRGTMDGINKAASADCYLTTGPCGGRPAEEAVIHWHDGTDYQLSFQKNADHCDKNTPGYFNVTMMHGHMVQHLAQIADDCAPSLTLYTPTVSLPASVVGHATIQVTYVTNNPNVPLTFYQCADVIINHQGHPAGK